MARATSKGTCCFCERVFGKAAMSRHLAACKARFPETVPAPAGRDLRRSRRFHLVISGRYAPSYWLHVEASAQATLDDLDSFLRSTWLECCGHLSAFRLGGRWFSSAPEVDWDQSDEGLDVKLGKLLSPGMSLSYEYDFGTTTDLTVKVVAERQGEAGAEDVQLLARNDPPEIACNLCDQPAALICTQCLDEGDGWLCEGCAGDHECGEDVLLPVVNSPRVGMCGYTGGAW